MGVMGEGCLNVTGRAKSSHDAFSPPTKRNDELIYNGLRRLRDSCMSL